MGDKMMSTDDTILLINYFTCKNDGTGNLSPRLFIFFKVDLYTNYFHGPSCSNVNTNFDTEYFQITYWFAVRQSVCILIPCP